MLQKLNARDSSSPISFYLVLSREMITRRLSCYLARCISYHLDLVFISHDDSFCILQNIVSFSHEKHQNMIDKTCQATSPEITSPEITSPEITSPEIIGEPKTWCHKTSKLFTTWNGPTNHTLLTTNCGVQLVESGYQVQSNRSRQTPSPILQTENY